MSHQLAIINKEGQEGFSLNGETLTMYSADMEKILTTKDALLLETFSLLDESQCIQCNSSIKYISGHSANFAIRFITTVPETYEYDISLYYIDNDQKLVHLQTLSVNNASWDKEVSFPCYGVFPDGLKLIDNRVLDSKFKDVFNDCLIFYTKFTRKDIPYIYELTPDVLLPSQITDCSLLFENDALSNFSIIVDDKVFHVHKEILAAKSSVFLVMFQMEMRERKENHVEIKDVDSEVFREMLRYIYTNSVNELSRHAGNLFRAADKYDLPNLKALCTGALARSLKVENAIATLVLADQYNDSTLRKITIKFIKGNIKSVLQTEEYKTWYRSAPPTLLGEILEAVVLS